MKSILGGRKRLKETKTPVSKKKRAPTNTVSSEDESRVETIIKTPKSTKKQKVIQEKETRKVQKVNRHITFFISKLLFDWQRTVGPSFEYILNFGLFFENI